MKPMVSVVVPTYARPQLLSRCLEALIAQELGVDAYEVIVVDDGPHAATQAVVERYAQRAAPGPKLRYVAVTGRHGPAAARNCGWRAAHADVVAFTDDDTIPDRRWLVEGLRGLHDAAALVGWVIVPIRRIPTDYELDAHGLEGAEFVTANCFVRKSALEQIGGFDERFRLAWREDSDLYFSLLEHKQAVVWNYRARVLHPVRPAGWGISLKQQRKNVFDALLYKKHPRLYRAKIRANAPWRYYLIVGALGGAVVGWAAGVPLLAVGGLLGWLGMTSLFCGRRLAQTSREPTHVVEMAVTSALIPALAVFWRLVGALRFRVLFF